MKTPGFTAEASLYETRRHYDAMAMRKKEMGSNLNI
jgi:hypothetical protein